MRPEITTVPIDPFPRSGHLRSHASFYRITTFLTVFAMLFGGILLLSAPAASARSGEGQAWEEPAPSDDSSNGGGAESTWTDGGVTLYVIDGNLNLRAAPSGDAEIVSVLADGTAVVTTGEMSGGYYGVTANGLSGYAFAEFLASAPAADVPADPAPVPTEEPAATEPPAADAGSVPVGDTVTGYSSVFDGPLNLRTGPGLGYAIIDVMPTGSALELLGEIQDGWYPVRYAGYLKGWASAEFIGGEPTPADPGTDEGTDDGEAGSVPVPGSDPVRYATVFDGNLNVRSGPGLTYAVIDVLPDGTEVGVLGDAQNGFLPVTYNGVSGWAFADYLSTSGTTPPDDGGTDPIPTEPPAEETPEPTEPPSSGDGYDSNGDGQWSRDELVAVITDAANAYGQPVEDMIRVAACESVWDPYAVNSSSGASGLFQFMPGTWLTTPYADQDIFDPVANANAAAWMWSVGRRNEWSCQ
jgi:uncharacterized protein YraI